MEVQVIHLRCLQRFILSGSYKMSMSSRKPFSLTNGTDCITTRAYGVPELQLELEDRRMGHPPFYMQGKLGKHTTNDKRIKNHRSSSRYIPWTQANQANAKLALPAWYYYNQAFDFARRQQFLSWCP